VEPRTLVKSMAPNAVARGTIFPRSGSKVYRMSAKSGTDLSREELYESRLAT
jgi:hypothetical protein